MIVILNIVLPFIILGLILILIKNVESKSLKMITGIIGFILCLLTAPLIILDYHYYNWVLEYFKSPVFLISIALILSLFISIKYFRFSIISLLSLAFVLNLTYQIILQMAEMGGDWEPNNCPDFAPPVMTFKNYNLIKGAGYFIHKTGMNGKIYREVSHRWELNSHCRTTFDLYNLEKTIVYDSCKNEILINE